VKDGATEPKRRYARLLWHSRSAAAAAFCAVLYAEPSPFSRAFAQSLATRAAVFSRLQPLRSAIKRKIRPSDVWPGLAVFGGSLAMHRA
jgi:hypothetical protein